MKYILEILYDYIFYKFYNKYILEILYDYIF
jgi:hypothetical protein